MALMDAPCDKDCTRCADQQQEVGHLRNPVRAPSILSRAGRCCRRTGHQVGAHPLCKNGSKVEAGVFCRPKGRIICLAKSLVKRRSSEVLNARLLGWAGRVPQKKISYDQIHTPSCPVLGCHHGWRVFRHPDIRGSDDARDDVFPESDHSSSDLSREYLHCGGCHV